MHHQTVSIFESSEMDLSGDLISNVVENLCPVDALADRIYDGSLGISPASASSGHPRFTFYKNNHRAEECQRKRRQEFIDHQKSKRDEYMQMVRERILKERTEEEKMEVDFDSGRVRTKLYADVLMLSEWLVDIPANLSSEWILVPCPAGKRCLVVARSGVTSAYDKKGRRLTQFHSYLPGGGGNGKCSGVNTLLDCIMIDKVFYCLDVIVWNGLMQTDLVFECRLFMLNSWITENQNFSEQSVNNKFAFKCLPYCLCENAIMEEFVKRDFGFTLSGVLFYYSQAFYTAGQSPLVGWLKPWMLPEILGVPVPSKLMEGRTTQVGSTQEFIHVFNKRYGHVSNVKNDAKAVIEADDDL